MIERRSSSNIDDVIDDEEGAGDILRFSGVHWGSRWTGGRLDADSYAAVVYRHNAFDLAGGDHQSANCIHKKRILLRLDKAQPLNGDGRSRSFDIERNLSRLNTREFTVIVVVPSCTRDGDRLRHQDHRWGFPCRKGGYRWGSVKRNAPLTRLHHSGRRP